MPIPKPKKNEKQDDFISRCMGDETMNKEYPDVKQRSGVCFSQWRRKDLKAETVFGFECGKCGLPANDTDDDMLCFKCGGELMKKDLKLETIDMPGIEIAEAGDWKGKGLSLTTQDIDESIGHFHNSIAEPYITLDHNPGLTKATQDFFKGMGLGFVKGMRRVGKKWLADFKQVPKLIAELVDSGQLKQRSIEFWKKFRHANGEVYNNVLEAVTFHGGNGLPAISSLNDIPKLFKDADNYKIKSIEKHEGVELVSIPFKIETPIKEVNNVEITKEEYQSFLKNQSSVEKLTSDIEALTEKVTTMKTEGDTAKEENEKLKKENEETKKLKADMDKTNSENLKKEADEFIDKIIVDKKRLPKSKDMLVRQYINLKNDTENEEDFKIFKEDLENSNEIINFTEVTKKPDEGSNKTEFKSNFEEAGDDDKYLEDADTRIKVQMKAKGYLESDPDSYIKAGRELGIIDKDPNEGGAE